MLLIPGGIIALIGLHLYLVVRLGVTSPPWSKTAAGRPRPEPRRPRTGRSHPRPANRLGAAQTDGRARHRTGAQEQFARYKEDVKREGKPFFPYAMWHDTMMALVVVCVIIALACIWYFTAKHAKDGVGHPRAARHRQGRPGHDELRAAAGLVLLLPLLPAADLQVARLGLPRHGRRADDPARPPDRAAVLRPRHGAAAAAPSGRARRRRARRHLDGDADLEGRAREGVDRARRTVPRSRRGRRSRASPTTGACGRGQVFASQTCLTCHTYLGAGSSNFGAPDLSAIGKGQNAAFFGDYIPNAATKYGNKAWPCSPVCRRTRSTTSRRSSPPPRARSSGDRGPRGARVGLRSLA